MRYLMDLFINLHRQFIESERRRNGMDRQVLDKAYFISFCIELYKHEKGLTGRQAMQLLDSYGVLEYPEANFDILHTQSQPKRSRQSGLFDFYLPTLRARRYEDVHLGPVDLYNDMTSAED